MTTTDPSGGAPVDVERITSDVDFEAPTILGTVEGWRAWRVSIALPRYGLAPKLGSVTHKSYFWTPRKRARAECRKDPTHVPGEGCICGFYSAKTYQELVNLGNQYHDYAGDEAGYFCVVGRLANWGKVIEGSQGWRSEYAYPTELYVPFEFARSHAARLEEAYGIPVRLRNILDRRAEPIPNITTDKEA
jgi:hypothetical protein